MCGQRIVDELPHVVPGALPLREGPLAFVSDAVIAARGAERGRLDAAGQESQRVKRAQNGVDRPLFENEPAFALGLNGFGDLVTIHLPARAGEHGQEDERR